MTFWIVILIIAFLFIANRILELHEIVIFILFIALTRVLEVTGIISGKDPLTGLLIGCACCTSIALYNAKRRVVKQ